MEFLTIISVNLLWIVYSMLEGIIESFFDYYQGLNKRICSFNIKRVFFLQRLLFLLLSALVVSYTLGLLSVLIALGHICMFKYFYKISYDLSSTKLNSEINEEIVEFSILKKMSKHRIFLLFFGMSLQIFIYIFIL